MAFDKIHFVYMESKDVVGNFARALIREAGQCPPEEADVIVSVGGDGELLQALDRVSGRTVNGNGAPDAAPDAASAGMYGKPIYGITPPGSTSRGFLTDHHVGDAESLRARLASAAAYPLMALEGTVRFANGAERTAYTHGDIVIDKIKSSQAAILHLSAAFNRASYGPLEFIGDGLVFATPLASTGYNSSNGGPPVDIRVPSLIVSGTAVYEPASFRHIAPVWPQDTVFTVIPPPATYEKRPLRVAFGNSVLISAEEEGSPIESLRVRRAPGREATLLMNGDPAALIFKKISP